MPNAVPPRTPSGGDRKSLLCAVPLDRRDMAYVPQYTHDVFVSYAHADDTIDASGQGWVAQFVACLEAALRQRLGGTGELQVFFDDRQLQANQQLDELLAAARGSAVFLAIASRSYAQRPWTQRELGAFSGSTGDLHRLFAVECLPLDEGDVYPAPLQEQKRIEFWQVHAPHSQTAVPLSPSLDSVQFHRRIHDVAEQIRKQLMLLRVASGKAPPTLGALNQAVILPARPACKVMLAQVTDDLEDQRDQLRSYLEQYGAEVLPVDAYLQDGVRFREALDANLQQSGLFVQLLGAYAGRSPPDLPEGYTRAQLASAQARKIDIMQWRPPDLDLNAIANASQRELLSGPHVAATGFEAFKAEVLRRATRPSPSAGQQPQGSLVFVNADRDDLDIAKQIQREFQNHSFPVALPALDGAAEDVRTDLEENLLQCDALVLVYGRTSPLWVRGQLRLYNKLKARRAGQPRVMAIYSGPPEDKQDIGFTLPDVQEIDARRSVTMTPVLPLIEALRT